MDSIPSGPSLSAPEETHEEFCCLKMSQKEAWSSLTKERQSGLRTCVPEGLIPACCSLEHLFARFFPVWPIDDRLTGVRHDLNRLLVHQDQAASAHCIPCASRWMQQNGMHVRWGAVKRTHSPYIPSSSLWRTANLRYVLSPMTIVGKQ